MKITSLKTVGDLQEERKKILGRIDRTQIAGPPNFEISIDGNFVIRSRYEEWSRELIPAIKALVLVSLQKRLGQLEEDLIELGIDRNSLAETPQEI